MARLRDEMTLAHIYLISVFINTILISIKKIFMCKIYVSTSIQC